MTDVQRPVSSAAPAREVPDSEKPVADLVADMTSKITELMRKEVEMAVVELKGEALQAAKAGGMIGGGAFAGYLAALFASFGVAWWFDRKLPRWFAFFLVAGMQGAAAAALLKRGAEEMQQVDPVPTQAIETLKDSVAWAKAQAG